MAQGEAAKRRQINGQTWADTNAFNGTVTFPNVVAIPIPTEATQVRVTNESSAITIRCGFGAGTTGVNGIALAFPRISQTLPIPPDATTFYIMREASGGSVYSVWFYAANG